MGTWGFGPFDNDTAADWAGHLDGAAPAARPALIREALTAVVTAKDYLDADDAMSAIAAAAVIAGTRPDGPEIDHNYGPDAGTLAALQLDRDLDTLATQALVRVMDEGSEWRELWEEADEFDDARRVLDALLAAIESDGTS
ncbi:DUF4259 domain-containing protein [Cellulomonas sp. URHE0023]|uniref:DUF4259 domain-containing protein n=1 Tax=Cellulomonas sp. URHE0023 TaxID=1380354 RepID=UPI00048931C5|nr:DUF4259 domain-containing protein [Cellulomonas sp. URHE0023]